MIDVDGKLGVVMDRDSISVVGGDVGSVRMGVNLFCGNVNVFGNGNKCLVQIEADVDYGSVLVRDADGQDFDHLIPKY